MSTGYVSQESKPVVYSESSLNYDRQTAISYENTPLSTTSKSLPLKNLQFHAANSYVPNLGTSQAPVAKASETDVLPSSTTVNLPDQSLLHLGNKCSFQATPASVSLAVKPQVYDEFSSPGHVTMTQHKHGSSFNGGASTPYFGIEFHHAISPLAGVSSIPLPLTYSTNCKDNLTWASCQPKRASSIYYSRPSFMIQAAPST